MNAPVTLIRTPAENAYVQAFEAARGTLTDNAAVTALREAAFAVFAATGLPHRRIEAWHYTDLRNLQREVLPTAEAHVSGADAVRVDMLSGGLEATRIVLINGQFVPDLSAKTFPKGVRVRALHEVLSSATAADVEALGGYGLAGDDSVFALNTALMQGGVVIDVEAGAEIAVPLHILSLNADASASTTRSLVRVGAGAKLTLIESHAGGAQKNDALILDIRDKANFAHIVRVSREASLDLASVVARIGADVAFDSFALVSGGKLVRRQLFVRLNGENTKVALGGVSLLKDKQHADTTLSVEHVAPHCESREKYKHIVADDAVGVFQGKICVAADAQKTDGKMMSNAVLLSETAVMNNKPELEIFADDVVCGHGATVGALDEDQIFYCQARGLPKPVAEALLLEAFAVEALDGITNESVRELLHGDISTWLKGRSA